MKWDEKLSLKTKYILSEYSTDQAILDESSKIICLNFQFDFFFLDFFKKFFGNKKKATMLKNIIVYCLNANKIKGYNQMYELFQRDAIIFFFRNKRILIDINSGNNNKMEIICLKSEKFFNCCQFMLWKVKKGKNAFLFI
nr:DIM1 family protein [Cryptomonas curvata]